MKRFLCLFTALALLAAAGLTAAGLTLHGAADDVMITEELLYGSAAAVSDITVTAVTQYDHRLFWSTAFPLGRPKEANTAFAYHPEGIPQEYPPDQLLDIYAGVNGSASGVFDNLNNLPSNYPVRLIEAVAERTAPGETREEVLNLRDYYETYPLDVSYRPSRTREEERAMNRAFSDYLSLPVPDVQNVTISLTKNQEGNINKIDCDTTELPFDLISWSVSSDDALFFALAQPTQDGTRDLLPDRLRGIHRIDFTFHESGIDFFDPDTLRMVYATDASAGQARQITLSEDGKRLLLVTENAEGASLSVLDTETMALLQTLPLTAPAGAEATVRPQTGTTYVTHADSTSVWTTEQPDATPAAETETWLECLRQEPGFLIAIRSDGAFDLMTEEGDGALGIRLSGNLLEHTDFGWPNFTNLALCYDGERLITGFSGYSPPQDNYNENTYESCAVTVAVHNADGLLYAGRYHSSIDRAYRESDDFYIQDVSPWGNDNEALSFQVK